MTKPAITPKEAAYQLRVSVDTIYAWLRKGTIRGTQPGGPYCAIQIDPDSVAKIKTRPPKHDREK